MFVDPSARHALCVLRDGFHRVTDTMYVPRNGRKPRVLAKLRGTAPTAVAWNRSAVSDSGAREILVGTSTGGVWELAVEDKDKKEKVCRMLFELQGAAEPIAGMHLETLPATGGGGEKGVRYV